MSGTDWPAFDDEVVRAMARWPDVPRCFGWLELDRRGNWRIRGETITHARAVAFLGRHYRADDDGRWYVQNGPQQVFVTLEYTPWVYRLDGNGEFVTHTGLVCRAIERAFVDDEGNLLVDSAFGIGVVDDRDLEACSAMFECEGDTPVALRVAGRRLPLESVAKSGAAARFGFEPAPAD